ncbi:MAG: RNA polymerase sigma factor [Deltaproteobacteria bacterium]|nr:RNA polymerase sigma factor [Deltaproteobacteria bacterium]
MNTATSHTPRPKSTDVNAEQALVRSCLAGDPLAWRQLYDYHFPMIDRLARTVGVHEAEADDLCQEIFVLLHKYLKHFRGDARLSTWIYRLTVRESIRFAKRRRLRRALTDVFVRERTALQTGGPWWENAPSRQRYLQQILGRLSPDRRMALTLFEIEGMEVNDIANVMGCKPNTVWTRIHRARQDLEKMCKEDET